MCHSAAVDATAVSWILGLALLASLVALAITTKLLADARREAERLQETVEAQLVETRGPRPVITAGRVVTKVVEAATRAREQGVGDGVRLGQVPQPCHQHEVLAAGQDLVDGRELAGEADRRPDARRVGRDVEPGDDGRSRVGAQQRAEDLHEGRLAGPVGAQQRDHAPPRDGEPDVLQDLLVAESLAETGNLDGWCG